MPGERVQGEVAVNDEERELWIVDAKDPEAIFVFIEEEAQYWPDPGVLEELQQRAASRWYWLMQDLIRKGRHG